MKHFAAIASIILYIITITGILFFHITFPIPTFLFIHIIAILMAIYGLSGAKILSSVAICLHGLGILYIIMLFNGM